MTQETKATQQAQTNAQWILAGENGWVARLLKGCMDSQYKLLGEFPETERKKGYGFACQLVVSGDEGGVFDLWFCEKGLQPKPPEVPLRNTVTISVDTLFDLITPDVSSLIFHGNTEEYRGLAALARMTEKMTEADVESKVLPRLRPRLNFRKAYANGLIEFGGDKPDIDSEMWSVLFDKVIYGLAFPIVIKGMISQGKKQRRK